MGGRVAEEIFVGDVSSGAQMDITQATRLIRSMICEWGMTEKLGTISYDERSDAGQYVGLPGYHEKNYSDATAKIIDEEVRAIIEEALKRAREIVEQHRVQVQLMTEMLIEFETLDRDDVLEIINGTWDIEKKKQRLKNAQDLQRKLPPPPPEQLTDREFPTPVTERPSPQQI
jgi:cell division protease FtsH